MNITITKTKVKLVRAVFFICLSGAAWVGYLSYGTSKPWAIGLSVLVGLVSIALGAVIAGFIYHEEYKRISQENEKMRELSDSTLVRMKMDLENIEKLNKEGRKHLCMASVVMAKVVSERVASRLISRYSKSFPNEEHLESAIREANEVVAEELVTYSTSLVEMKKK